jgi:predicted nucleic acid-binding protein
MQYELFETPKKINEKKYPNIRDINDLPILVSAILSDADILLTGDKDFEEIKINKPLIFTPKQYFDLIKK